MATILCDFDGTVIPRLPEIGVVIQPRDIGAAEVLKELTDNGHKIILWTCRDLDPKNPYNQGRDEKSLEEAINWFKNRNIPLYGINSNPNTSIDSMLHLSTKPLGDHIIDDTAIGAPLINVRALYHSINSTEIKRINTVCIDWIEIRKFFKSLNYI